MSDALLRELIESHHRMRGELAAIRATVEAMIPRTRVRVAPVDAVLTVLAQHRRLPCVQRWGEVRAN